MVKLSSGSLELQHPSCNCSSLPPPASTGAETDCLLETIRRSMKGKCDTPLHLVLTSQNQRSSGPFLLDRRRISLKQAVDIYSHTKMFKCANPIELLPIISIKA